MKGEILFLIYAFFPFAFIKQYINLLQVTKAQLPRTYAGLTCICARGAVYVGVPQDCRLRPAGARQGHVRIRATRGAAHLPAD